MSQTNFKFYRYLYDNLAIMRKSEYDKVAGAYKSQLGDGISPAVHNTKMFNFFMFNLSEVVDVPTDIQEKCMKRYLKISPNIRCIEDRYQRILEINTEMFETAQASFRYLRLYPAIKESVSNNYYSVEIEGVFILLKQVLSLSIARAVFSDDLYGIYYNHKLFFIVDIAKKEVVYQRYEYEEKRKILFDSKTQLKRHLLLYSKTKEE